MKKGHEKKRKFPHLLASKWTAVQAVLGWRHFIVCNRQDRHGIIFAELQSVCHPETRIWVNAQTLKNRDVWQPGWQEIPSVNTTLVERTPESCNPVQELIQSPIPPWDP